MHVLLFRNDGLALARKFVSNQMACDNKSHPDTGFEGMSHPSMKSSVDNSKAADDLSMSVTSRNDD